MGSNEDRIVEAFRQRFRYDRGLRRLKPVADYQRIFRGFDEAIVREYARLETEAGAQEAAPAPDAPPPPGAAADTTADGPRRVGRFALLRELGRGGQGAVHLAEDTRLRRQVALKLLNGEHIGFGAALDRFRREAEITAKLDHPGICTIYEAGEDDGVPWIAMRHVEGEPLSARIEASRASNGIGADSAATSSVVQLPASGDERGKAPPVASTASHVTSQSGAGARAELRRVCLFVEKAARALHAAHENGLVHRDIKPGNVMVTTGGDPVLLDFGLARDMDSGQPTITGTPLGTPAYMSPELLVAQRVPLDARCDVWSLGVTLHECLTLRRPFDAPTRDALYHQILSKEPEDARRLNPTVSRDLAIVVQTALQKDRDRRYQTALDLAEDLRRVREDQPIRARPVSSAERLGRWARRNPALAASVTGLIVVLTAGLTATSALLGEARTARVAERAQRDRALADAARQAELNDVRAALLAVGTLFPKDEASVTLRTRLVSRAARALDSLPTRKAELAGLGARARPGSGDPPEFADPTDAATYRVLTDFVTDAEAVAAPGTGALAVLNRRFTPSTTEDTTALWRRTIAEISDEKANPVYRGLAIRPQWGLRPLGKDPDSHLFEFAHLWSGSLPERKDGHLVQAPDAAIVFVLIPGGTFWMGAAKEGEHDADTLARDHEGPVHEVALSAYFLSKYECTQAQWERLTGGERPSEFKGGDPSRLPVEQVSWDQCVGERRTGWLSSYGLTLPSEAQWEYACRAGSSGRWTWGDDERQLGDYAWYASNSNRTTHPVGLKKANAFGLHDIHGNLFEWCEDAYVPTYDGAPADGSARETGGTARVRRGGCWADTADLARSAFRHNLTPGLRFYYLGLRPARRVAAN